MKPLHAIFILLLLAHSCTSKSEKPETLPTQAATPADTTTKAPPESRAQRFQRFLSMLPTQSLPLHLYCRVDRPYISRDSLSQFSEFFPRLNNFDAVVAKFERYNSKFNTILFALDDAEIIPMLSTFDNDGNFIDSLWSPLFACKEYGGVHSESYFFFEKNNRIRVLDTAWYWKAADVEFEDAKFDSTVVTEENYILNTAGKFIKQK